MIGGFCDNGGALLASSTSVDTGSTELVPDPALVGDEADALVDTSLLSSGGRLPEMGETTRERTGGDGDASLKLSG
jgi:hypothetical protein